MNINTRRNHSAQFLSMFLSNQEITVSGQDSQAIASGAFECAQDLDSFETGKCIIVRCSGELAKILIEFKDDCAFFYYARRNDPSGRHQIKVDQITTSDGAFSVAVQNSDNFPAPIWLNDGLGLVNNRLMMEYFLSKDYFKKVGRILHVSMEITHGACICGLTRNCEHLEKITNDLLRQFDCEEVVYYHTCPRENDCSFVRVELGQKGEISDLLLDLPGNRGPCYTFPYVDGLYRWNNLKGDAGKQIFTR